MKPFYAFVLGMTVLLAPLVADGASAQTPSPNEKLNAYVGCINRLSARAYDLRKRYFSWVGKNGPTGQERIIYGAYTIYDTSNCKKNVEKANALEPRWLAAQCQWPAWCGDCRAVNPRRAGRPLRPVCAADRDRTATLELRRRHPEQFPLPAC